MLVEEREDPAAPRRRGGVVVRERDLPLGHDDMASTVNTRMEKGNRKGQLQSLNSLKTKGNSRKQTKEDQHSRIYTW